MEHNRKHTQKVILITGATSGFGMHTAALLASHGNTVYGTFRKGEVPTGVIPLFLDLTDPSSLEKAAAEVYSKEKKIDILINNAGIGIAGPAEETAPEEIRLQMDTNFTGHVLLTQAVLKYMRVQGSGTLMFISSLGGLMALPYQAYYSASKYALEGYCDALRMELSGSGIRVIVINPGDFHTGFTRNRMIIQKIKDRSNPHTAFNRTLSVIEKDENGGLDPAKLAGKIYAILSSNSSRQRYIVASPEQKLAYFLKRILPGKWFYRILSSHYGIH